MVITIIVDWIRLGFSSLVIFISACVLIYRTVYINIEKFFFRFIIIVYLFVLSIIFLIFSPNLVSLLLGWDGLGLVSYCLVIYYQNIKSANAGIVTILSNRVGDVAILLSIAWLFNFGGWNFFYLQFIVPRKDLFYLIVLIVLAAITKSAQMPFSAWLPAAIAAPTPVSSLVHSSTLVTAGVYLLIRFRFLIYMNSFLLYVGVLTMLMAGASANFECDLKKIIALSTLSQLGLIIMVIGLGLNDLSFFHLITHAIFKSLLFLCAGVFIHSYGEIQDIRFISRLVKGLPVSSFYFIICSMALCGFPFLSGFYSKDLILELFIMGRMNLGFWLLVCVATIFTLSYSIRLSWLIFIGGGAKKNLLLEEEEGIIIPISFLLALSLYAGCWIRLFLTPLCIVFLPSFFKLFILARLAAILVIYFQVIKIVTLKEGRPAGKLLEFIRSIWFLPPLTRFVFFPLLNTGAALLKYLDQGWTEKIVGRGAVGLINRRAVYSSIFNFVGLKFYLLRFFFIFFMFWWVI